MRPDPVVQFWLGLGGIGLLLLVALGAWAVPDFFDHRLPGVAIFKNVAELMEGAEVKDGGFVIGRVTRIEPQLKEHRFVVRFRLNPGWSPRGDDGVIVDEPNLFRAAILSVVESSDCHEPFSDPSLPGLQFRSCAQRPNVVDVALQTVAATKATIEQANAILTIILPTSEDAQAGGPGAAPGLKDLLARAEATLTNLETLSSASGLGAVLASTKATLADVQALSATARSALDQKQQQQFREIVDNLASSSKNADTAINSLNKLLSTNAMPAESALADLRSILATTAASMSEIVVNMQATSVNIKEITARLRDDPNAAIRGQQLSDPAFVAKPRR